MGIPIERFSESVQDSVQHIICTFCLDVAEDPGLVNGCEHIFCRSCLEGQDVSKCPTCQEPLKDSKWSAINGLLRRIYLKLTIKCINYPDCEAVLDASNYKNHDATCDLRNLFYICPHGCGYRTRIDANNDVHHSCTQQVQLKDLKMEVGQVKKMVNDMKNNLIMHRHRVSQLQQFIGIDMTNALSQLWMQSKRILNNIE